MIENMYTVMQRINELKKRFGLKKHADPNIMQNSFQKETVKRLNEKSDSALSSISNSKPEKKMSIPEIKELVNNYAVRAGISPNLVKAVIQTESNYNQYAVSPKGALGLMQLMPKLARELGVANPLTAEDNIRGGISHLRHLLEKYDWDYKKTLAAYNAGEKAVEKNNGIPPYKETTEYIKKVISEYMKNSE